MSRQSRPASSFLVRRLLCRPQIRGALLGLLIPLWALGAWLYVQMSSYDGIVSATAIAQSASVLVAQGRGRVAEGEVYERH